MIKDVTERELRVAKELVNAKLAPKVQWVHSFVTPDRGFCIYLPESEAGNGGSSLRSEAASGKNRATIGASAPTTAA